MNMADKFGFIGTGNMGGALAQAVAKSIGGEQMLLADYFMDKAKELAAELYELDLCVEAYMDMLTEQAQ